MTILKAPRPSVPRTDDGPPTNGNGREQTTPPRPLSDVPLFDLQADASVVLERTAEKVDELLTESRNTRLWRAQVGSMLNQHGSALSRLEMAIERIDAGVLELVADVHRVERTAKAAKDESARASQSNEFAIEHAKSDLALNRREHELELAAQEAALAERAKRSAAVRIALRKVAEHGLSALLVGIITYILAAKGCHP